MVGRTASKYGLFIDTVQASWGPGKASYEISGLPVLWRGSK